MKISKLPYTSNIIKENILKNYDFNINMEELKFLSNKFNIKEKLIVFGIHSFIISRFCNVNSYTTKYNNNNIYINTDFLDWKDYFISIEKESLTVKETDDNNTDINFSTENFNSTNDLLINFKNNSIKIINNTSKDTVFEPLKYEKYFNTLLKNLNIKNNLEVTDIFTKEDIKDITVNTSKYKTPNKYKLLPEILLEQLKNNPKKVALITENKNLKYSQLIVLVTKMMTALDKEGVKKGDVVAVYMERDIAWSISMLALMCMGAIYVPLEIGQPKLRSEQILSQSEASYVIIEDKNLVLENKLNYKNLTYSEVIKKGVFNKKLLENLIKEDDSSYILFTSGTTGIPKGAIIEHQGMMNHLNSKIVDLKLNENDVIAQNATQSFDISIWQLLTSFIIGGTTVIYSKNLVWSTKDFIEYTIKNNITILEVVPSYLELLLEEFKENLIIPNIKYLMVTGERVTGGVLKRWFQHSDISVVNAYGPTEASDDITHHFIHKGFQEINIPVGSAIPHVRIYILDENLKLLPLGSIGEVCVSGICVGKGYINREKETKLAFNKDVYANDQYNKLYKTGDIGRINSEHILELYGRNDEQVKINGIRIEISEIEHYVSIVEGVKEVAIIKSENKLICFYTGNTEEKIIKSELLKSVNSAVIPELFKNINFMPLNLNGKIDKKLLK
jgi:amino acid adenylation domain-containing protein